MKIGARDLAWIFFLPLLLQLIHGKCESYLLKSKATSPYEQLQGVAVWGKLENPASSRSVLIYFEFRSKPSFITVICMYPRPTNYLRQNIVFSYPDMIWVSFSSFLSLPLFDVILNFYKKYFITVIIIIIIIIIIFLFCMESIFIFSCSGMFREVPECSVFLVLSIPPCSMTKGSWYAIENKWNKLNYLLSFTRIKAYGWQWCRNILGNV